MSDDTREWESHVWKPLDAMLGCISMHISLPPESRPSLSLSLSSTRGPSVVGMWHRMHVRRAKNRAGTRPRLQRKRPQRRSRAKAARAIRLHRAAHLLSTSFTTTTAIQQPVRSLHCYHLSNLLSSGVAAVAASIRSLASMDDASELLEVPRAKANNSTPNLILIPIPIPIPMPTCAQQRHPRPLCLSSASPPP
ncbi:hypothetical protein K402DRAFT_66841 [Aulographum hederae CBS 113979]|uniref:Uncharacterized protein n=1 Tax=Aulographum hederae CBS 113979 TaxID=1176131 RepID=A0A6G1H1B7_9PEZI|nr:hypothetical protein K402DRAFT_66841 [Aulographum hederae CBS 113979]